MFKYKKYKAALDYFGIPKNVDCNFKTYCALKEKKFRSVSLQEQKEVDLFNIHHKLIKDCLYFFYEKEKLTYLVNCSSTQLSDDWKMESLNFFNNSEFAIMKKLHTKHGKKLCQRSPKYS